MKKSISLFLFIVLVMGFLCSSCRQNTPAPTESPETEEAVMHLLIGKTEVPVIWENNESVKALQTLAKEGLVISMSMYGGFEQVGALGQSLPRNDSRITTEAGDIVLYSGNQIVIFYGSNSWAYTRLGHIRLSAGDMAKLLGAGDVTVTITFE